MKIPDKKMAGDELDQFLKNASDYSIKSFQQYFAKYEPISLYHHWRLLVRSIDEFLNLYEEIDDPAVADEFINLSFNFSDMNEANKFMNVYLKIGSQFGQDVALRFLHFGRMNYKGTVAYERNNLNDMLPFNFAYVSSAILYYQSKRKYYVTLLDLIPTWAKGSFQFDYIDTLGNFQYIIDTGIQTTTSLYYDTILKNIFTDFSIDFTKEPPLKSHNYYNLEGLFLEPQILTMLDQLEFRREQTESIKLIPMPVNKIFSFVEVENHIQQVAAVFQKYELRSSTAYMELSFLVNKLKDYCMDDFNIVVPEQEFDMHIKPFIHEIKMFANSSDYSYVSNFVPLLQLVDHTYYSSVVLLNRFIANRMQLYLNKKKSFQINSGFVFEDKIRKVLNSRGFEIKPITRIKRKEFDVITVKDGKIYNFQCKNNFIDIARQQDDPLLMARINSRLVRYYTKAYRKEFNREDLVTNELNIDKIQHFVLSRYPVISEIDYIINFNELESTIDSWFS
jgi:hypothetical protein